MSQVDALVEKIKKEFIYMSKLVEIENREGIYLLTINREKALNALNKDVFEQLDGVMGEIKKSQGLIITGAGEKAFVAGADIKAMSEMSVGEAKEFAGFAHKVMNDLEELPFPTVAAVNGFALGGGLELALVCDLIFASKNALLGLPEVKLGLIPGFGGTQRLARKYGVSLAKKLIFSANPLSAQEAYDKGLVESLFETKEEMLKSASDFIQGCSKNSPMAVKTAKEVIKLTEMTNLEQGLKGEIDRFASLFASSETKEGVAAFLEKRKPNFNGGRG